ncbi:MAG: PqqD family peptide modification chaperone [Gemmatimonadetes bacterium]|nr:PqqD family peptide modification chaperone [Gemmatimonadota bacterium]MBT6146207.1 PqqD family peptide modification chaperone [Gemmatimonadota bacterium]MBT7864124.1 PqqD family peptide modification chaperone [Gemmatimonadota bacterium]
MYVPLEAEEIPWAERLDLSLHPGDGTPPKGFSQPCWLHQNGRCSAYAERPGACSLYECGLLKAYLQNQITMDDSMSIVADARHLIDTIQQRIRSEASSESIWQQIAAHIDGQGADRETVAGRFAHVELLLAEQQLAYLCRHFETREGVQLATQHLPGMEAAQTAMQSARQRSWKPPAHVHYSERSGDIVIVDLSAGVTSALSGVAANMWLALMTHNNLDDVMETLLEQYEVEEKTLRDDLWRFVEELAARGVLDVR